MFYQGIVENNIDELKLGRCQIRIFGIHPEDKNEYPTEDLPWAEAAFPISSQNISGISDFMIPKNGSFVWLFFKDPEQQYPVYFATSPKIEKTPDFTKGFSDPKELFPEQNNIDQSGISKLARNEDIINTSIQQQKDSQVSGISIAFSGTWNEPTTQYNTIYPYNRVIETESGHVEEFDDTPGLERRRSWHKSGTFSEIYPNGQKVKKIVNDNYKLVSGDDFIYITGNANVTVSGNINILCNSDVNIETIGNLTLQTNGNVSHTVGGNYDLTVTGNITLVGARIDLN